MEQYEKKHIHKFKQVIGGNGNPVIRWNDNDPAHANRTILLNDKSVAVFCEECGKVEYLNLSL